ncbi:unnamed protein product [Heligmosomoides polygyrus]|uniref:Uncharacterized protein n=1 Tax=Heligmosomoides polygyrus TaxID=6339 RepID=A0A183GAI3_HELPZ|nr:unnamed protein product [Heligmosomoides polygyrus]
MEDLVGLGGTRTKILDTWCAPQPSSSPNALQPTCQNPASQKTIEGPTTPGLNGPIEVYVPEESLISRGKEPASALRGASSLNEPPPHYDE